MNNLQFTTVIIGFVTLLLAIMGGAWLNQRALERQMDSQRKEFDAKLDALKAELLTLNTKLDLSLRPIAERLEKIDRQLEAIFKPVLPR